MIAPTLELPFLDVSNIHSQSLSLSWRKELGNEQYFPADHINSLC